ncbi:hypothetical protein DFH27DRAFT_521182 [Peziza echinospora]|nr:hypothetical protein DFH27DRAFT_521182 [Peziza echinospora]
MPPRRGTPKAPKPKAQKAQTAILMEKLQKTERGTQLIAGLTNKFTQQASGTQITLEEQDELWEGIHGVLDEDEEMELDGIFDDMDVDENETEEQGAREGEGGEGGEGERGKSGEGGEGQGVGGGVGGGASVEEQGVGGAEGVEKGSGQGAEAVEKGKGTGTASDPIEILDTGEHLFRLNPQSGPENDYKVEGSRKIGGWGGVQLVVREGPNDRPQYWRYRLTAGSKMTRIWDTTAVKPLTSKKSLAEGYSCHGILGVAFKGDLSDIKPPEPHAKKSGHRFPVTYVKVLLVHETSKDRQVTWETRTDFRKIYGQNNTNADRMLYKVAITMEARYNAFQSQVTDIGEKPIKAENEDEYGFSTGGPT